MDNITTTLVDVMLNYTTSTTTITEWPLDMLTNNNNLSNSDDTMSLLITPLALASKHNKHHPHLENVSPVTLSSEWSRLARLIFLTILSVVGSVGNIFMISSVMIEDHLKKAGNLLSTNQTFL